MQGDGLCNNITDADAISFNLYYNFLYYHVPLYIMMCDNKDVIIIISMECCY